MTQIYNIQLENRLYDNNMEKAEAEYSIWVICAEQLGITVDEYVDFMLDMELETNDYTLDEIEQMYIKYCQEPDILCMQINISNPIKLYGAI